VPLADLHRHVPPEDQRLDDTAMNAVTRAFYAPDEVLRDGYHHLIRSLAASHGHDFLFQAAPIVRFHFPVPFPDRFRGPSGHGTYFHSDLMGGHPPEMVNAWLALTPTEGTAALHIAPLRDGLSILETFTGSLDDFVARNRTDAAHERRLVAVCRPLPMDEGDLVLFDPRCIHGGAENVEDATRVSLDFRIVPLSTDGIEAIVADRYPRWRRGDILDRRSAHDLG
jgi:hypothetical protein